MVEKNDNKTLKKHTLRTRFSLFLHHFSYKVVRAVRRWWRLTLEILLGCM